MTKPIFTIPLKQAIEGSELEEVLIDKRVVPEQPTEKKFVAKVLTWDHLLAAGLVPVPGSPDKTARRLR